jgi:hypothetical protein
MGSQLGISYTDGLRIASAFGIGDDPAVRWVSPPLVEWLTAATTVNGTYRHTLLSEAPANRASGLAALGALTAEAHRDARERLERLAGISLDPLQGAPPDWRPYPDELHTSALQGYMGEVLAGVVAENYQPHGQPWTVPGFLFRGHQAAYQELERRRQLGGPARPIPGRTGDDALAFQVDEDGAVIAWLWAEAKCTHDHNSELINAGHRQLSAAIRVPVDLVQLIDVLAESQDPSRERWIASLRELLYSADPPPRYDLFVYVCGRRPARRATWIPSDRPHANYSGAGPLAATEIHLSDFDEVLVAAYPQHVIDRG